MGDWLKGNAAQPAATTIQRILRCPEAIRALMYCAASTSPGCKSNIIYPLAAANLPAEHHDALIHSVVLAVQREEDSHLAPGKALIANEQAVMVFKFVRIK